MHALRILGTGAAAAASGSDGPWLTVTGRRTKSPPAHAGANLDDRVGTMGRMPADVATPTQVLGVAMRDRRRRAGGVQAEKQQRYVQLIAQGVNNSEACRLVGIDRKTGNRWRYGRRVRNSAGALVIYPPVKIRSEERRVGKECRSGGGRGDV